jgi:hypothetical protein
VKSRFCNNYGHGGDLASSQDRHPATILVVKKIIWIVAQIVWLAICLLALIEAGQGYRGTSDWQVEEGLAFEMMVLSFPCSLLVTIGLVSTGAILGLFGLALPASSRLEMIGTWLLFVVAGYGQWFILLPRFMAQCPKTTRSQ